MRDGEPVARKLAIRWGFECSGAQVTIRSDTIHALYRELVRMCYLTPPAERILPLALALFNLQGRLGMTWLRRQLRKRSGNKPEKV